MTSQEVNGRDEAKCESQKADKSWPCCWGCGVAEVRVASQHAPPDGSVSENECPTLGVEVSVDASPNHHRCLLLSNSSDDFQTVAGRFVMVS